MVTTSRTFTVTPSPDVVLAYLRDFSHAEEWDPGTVSCTQVGDGPVQVGTRWDNTSKIAGNETSLVYELTDEADDRVVFVGTNKSAKSTDTIKVVPASAGGSEITYRADLEMKGLAKLLSPAMKLLFEKLGNDTEKQLTEVLNNLR